MRPAFTLRPHAPRRAVRAALTLAAALALTPANAQGPAHAQAASSARADQAVAVDARLIEKGGETLLEFDLSRAVEAHAFVLADPDRVVVELPEVAFRIDGDRRAAKGLVRSFRYGQFAQGRSRVVIDLAKPARVARAEAATFSRDGLGPARLTVALAPESREAFRVAARRNAPLAREEAAPLPSAQRAGKPVVVIDPGHGGVDSGAVSHALDDETLEKTVVLDFARDLARRLEGDGRFKVVMTRESDVFVSLDERVRIARAAGAALFVSIHADSLRNAQGVSGATVYTVSDRASDAEAARIAESENAADRAAGVDSAESGGEVADILFDLTRRETRAFAGMFSRDLVARMSQATTMHRIPNRAAGFKVLKAPDVPSVLIELGYLSSAKDVKAMTSPEWRARSAQAVGEAVRAFMAGASPVPPARDAAAPAPAVAARR
jgi:N-acetylmuramoyl-L-alanine amidase